MKHLILAALAALTLSACSADRVYGTIGAVITSDPELKEFTLKDIAVASEMAHAQNDVLAYTCYDFLLVRLPEMGIGLDTPAPVVAGAFSAFQRARSGVKAANTGVSDEFKVACYPLIMDAKEDIQSVGRALGRLVL
jgi:hypothetical protein